MPSVHQAHLLIDNRAAHGEGPVWDEYNQLLHWVDLTGHTLYSLKPGAATPSAWRFVEPVCAVAPQPNGRLLIALTKRLVLADLQSKTIESICAVEAEKPGNRCNDGKLDPTGRFWIGTMSNDGTVEGAGSLYYLDGDRQLRRVLDGLTISNGMAWTPDQRTMYFIDSPRREIWAFDFDPDRASISRQRVAIDLSAQKGVPDGMTITADGTLWVAQWGDACVNHWDPKSGRLLERVETGCPHTSSCCLGPDNTLYITTSRLGLSEEQLREAPHSGGLFMHSTISA